MWKKYELSIQNGIDNCTEIIKIKPDFASLNRKKIAGSLANRGFSLFVLAKFESRMGNRDNKIVWNLFG